MSVTEGIVNDISNSITDLDTGIKNFCGVLYMYSCAFDTYGVYRRVGHVHSCKPKVKKSVVHE